MKAAAAGDGDSEDGDNWKPVLADNASDDDKNGGEDEDCDEYEEDKEEDGEAEDEVC